MADEEKRPYELDKRAKVGPDGKCVMTGYPCVCNFKSGGHWCCWSFPADKVNEPAPTDSPSPGPEKSEV
jgi:hypothetical protein